MTLLGSLLGTSESRAIRDNGSWSAWARGDDFGATSEQSMGVRVTRESSLGVATVWACVSLLADAISTLPIDVTTTDDDGTINILPRPKWLDTPNGEQTRVDWIFSQVASLLLNGNIFMYTVRNGAGDVIEAWPMDPNFVQVRREILGDGSTQLVYYVMVAKGMMSPVGPFRVPAGPDMFHIPYFMVSSNYPRGLPPLEIARQMFGGAIAGQEMGAKFFGHGMNASGVIEIPDAMTYDQARGLKRDFKEANGGLKNMGLPPVLTGGATWKQIQVSPEQAQFLQQREFSVSEIARFFRIPPFMVGELTRSTSWGTGLEQQSTGFVQYTLRPLLERIEEAWSRWILWTRPNQRVRFNVEGLLRGDRATRASFYATGRQWGYLSVNDVRKEEGMPPLPGEDGDVYLQPMNMAQPAGISPLAPGTPEPEVTVPEPGQQPATPEPAVAP